MTQAGLTSQMQGDAIRQAGAAPMVFTVQHGPRSEAWLGKRRIRGWGMAAG